MFRGRGVELKTPEQIKIMRRAGLVVARALGAVRSEARAGLTTGELDAIAHQVISSAGATPSFLDYGQEPGQPGFPAVTCISVNDEVVHGIPGDRVLADGDLISVDCGAIIDGWHGDAAVTIEVGAVGERERELSAATRRALWAGIGAVTLGGHVTDISAAIEAQVRSEVGSASLRYGIVEDYVGHGIGSAMHQPPDVPNSGRAGRGPKIVEGLCLAIEPMLTLGTTQSEVLDDEWTVVTTDGSWASHWEHTVTRTARGLWVLTAPDGGEAELTAAGLPFGPLAD